MKLGQLAKKLIMIDRRVIYIVMIIAITFPFFIKPRMKVSPTPWVKKAHSLIEKAKENNRPILMGFDFDSSTMAELKPLAEALLRHIFANNIKVVAINFMSNGASLAANILKDIGDEFDKKYGKDYAFLGFLPQSNLVLVNLGIDLRKSYRTDFYGKELEKLPLLNGIKSYHDFELVIDISSNKYPLSYIMYGVDRYGFDFLVGSTAIMAAGFFPYIQSGQMDGLIPGMKGAAEYENLTGNFSDATIGMASQFWGHVTIIFFIIIGNILYFIKKREDQKLSPVKNPVVDDSTVNRKE